MQKVDNNNLSRDQLKGKSMDIEKKVFQFKISLRNIKPEIWRRIVVPANYSFWDLHVAIQDSMGWLDSHLHAFNVKKPDSGMSEQIGIPDDDYMDDELVFLPGWEILIAKYFHKPGDNASYEYDFGDAWEHEIILEMIGERGPKTKYPQCLDGARACPPEDCGGTDGYNELLTIIADPSDEEHESTMEWLGGKYDPEKFNNTKVRFDNPKKRLKEANIK
jgi:hypothetical protein